MLPPDHILSTFPPAGASGDWRSRFPQIVLKRRTLPWERNPTPDSDPHTAPPWLALVVLADGEGFLSPDVDVAGCATAEPPLAIILQLSSRLLQLTILDTTKTSFGRCLYRLMIEMPKLSKLLGQH